MEEISDDGGQRTPTNFDDVEIERLETTETRFIRNDDFERFVQTANHRVENEINAGASGGFSVMEEAPRQGNNNDQMFTLVQTMLEQNRQLMGLLERERRSHSPPRNANVPRYHVIPDFSKTIKTFSGENLSESSTWIKALLGTAALHQWPDEFKLEAARTHLVGPAREWYEGRRDGIKCWADFEAAFRRTFIQEISVTQLWKAMTSRVQNSRESVHSYFHEKTRLCRQLKLSFAEEKEQVLVGLFSREIASMLMAKNHCNEDDLYADIVTFERIASERREIHKVDKSATLPTQKKNVLPIPTQSNNIKQEPKVQEDKRNSSSVNKKKSEFLPPRDEQNRPLCFKCKKYGHVSKYCVTDKKGVEADAAVKSKQCVIVHDVTSDKEDRNLKYFQEASINEKPVKSYVDLGSQCVMLRKTDAEKLKLEYEELSKPLLITGYGKGSIKPIGKLKAKIKVDQASAETEIMIVPDECQEIPLLIGQPFTEQYHIVIIRRGNTLRIFEERNPDVLDDCLSNLKVPELPSSKINLWAKSTSVIPDKFVGFVSIYATDRKEEDLYIEKQTDYIKCIPRCVIRVDETGTAEIPVVNVSGRDLVVNKDEKVIKGLPCKEEIEEIDEVAKVCVNRVDKNVEIDENMINVSENTPSIVKMKLVEIIRDHRDCFALNMSELGCAKEVECVVETTTEEPITFRPYRLSYSEREKVRDLVDELKCAGIIVDSSSDYASPMLIVKKKNGEDRICIDYRALNKVTKKIKYPLPMIDDQIDRLSGKKYFTTLDMRSGYYQIPMSRNSQHKTAFITPDGSYEFTKMPFGLANGPAIFQKLINSVLGPLRFSIAMAYMDDILLPSATHEEGLNNLCEVLKVIKRANLKLNLKKCYFFYECIDYLGFELSAEGIKPGRKKLASVENFPVPQNVHSLRQFIGLTSYFRRFIKNYASVAKPLTELLRKDSKWSWTDKQINSFNKLKQVLISEGTVLALYSPNAYTEVHTDASQLGLGGILMQRGTDGKMRPVVFASRQTTSDEQKYHSNELETLCVIWVLEKLRVYLIGIKFVVVTDCSALRSTFAKKQMIPRVARWWLKSLEFEFEVVHRPGSQMYHVDALSRNPSGDPEETEVVEGLQILANTIEEEDWLCIAQRTDPKIQQIIEALKKKEKSTKEDRRIAEEYEMKDGRLFRRKENKLLWVVPKRSRWQIARRCHDALGHPALQKTVEKIQENYWFPRLRNYVKGYIGSCLECLYHKTPKGKPPGYLHSIDKVGIPFDTIHLDHLGPFVKSKKGNSYLLVIIDGFTKFVFLKPCKGTTSRETSQKLEEIIYVLGPPRRVITDRGTAFTGASFEKICREKGIVHVRNATQTPRGNGQVERINQIITPSLASLSEDDSGRDWDKHIGRIQWAINNTYHRTVKDTPFYLLFNYKPRDIDNDRVLEEIQQQFHENTIEERRLKAIQQINEEQQRQRQDYNKRRSAATSFEVGDLVLVKKQIPATGESRKLLNKYKGPYIITEKLPYDRYRIEDLPETQRTQKFYRGVAAVDALKRFGCGNELYDSNTEEEEEQNEEESSAGTPENDDKLDDGNEIKEDNPKQEKVARKRTKPNWQKDYVC